MAISSNCLVDLRICQCVMTMTAILNIHRMINKVLQYEEGVDAHVYYHELNNTLICRFHPVYIKLT
jgi:hypothetical protein